MSIHQGCVQRLRHFLDRVAAASALPAAPYARGTPVFTKGQPAGSLFLLRSGRVRIFQPASFCREIILRIAHAGHVFGEEGFAGGGVRGLEALALDDAVVTEVPRAVFLQAAGSEPEALRLLAEVVDLRRAEVLRRVELLHMRNVQQRLLVFLSGMAAESGEGHRNGYVIHLRQGDVAGLIGATRETTSVNLNALARQGYIELGRCHLRIPSPAAIHQAARAVYRRGRRG